MKELKLHYLPEALHFHYTFYLGCYSVDGHLHKRLNNTSQTTTGYNLVELKVYYSRKSGVFGST